MNETERLKLEEAVRALAVTNGGRFTAEMIVEAARDNPASPFFPYFEWDVNKAAWAHWMDRARELIRSIRVEVIVEDRTFRIAEFVRDPEAARDRQGYVSVKVLHQEPDNAAAAIMNEYAVAAAYLERAKGLAEYLGVQKPQARATKAVQQAMKAVKAKV